MKKLSRIAALLAATALLLGAFGCSSGGGSGNSDDNSDDDDQELEDDYTGPATTDSWNFVGNAKVFGIITGGTNTGASDKVTYTIDEQSIEGIDGNLTLSLLAGSGINYAVQSAETDTASTKGLRFKGDALKISGVKGNVVLTFDYTAAGTGARTLTVTAGSKKTTKDTSDSDTHSYEQAIKAGAGTDILISATNNYWIKEIKITESDGTIQPPEDDDEEKEEEEKDLSSIFTIEDGYLNLKADKYEYSLSKENLEATTGNNAWSTASADALANTAAKAGKTTFKNSITAVNMSKPERNITLKVKGVAAIDVHVFDSNGDRDYTVKVGSAEAVTYTSVKNEEGNVIKTNTTDEVEIVIAGVSQSVYPVGVILYKTAPAE